MTEIALSDSGRTEIHRALRTMTHRFTALQHYFVGEPQRAALTALDFPFDYSAAPYEHNRYTYRFLSLFSDPPEIREGKAVSGDLFIDYQIEALKERFRLPIKSMDSESLQRIADFCGSIHVFLRIFEEGTSVQGVRDAMAERGVPENGFHAEAFLGVIADIRQSALTVRHAISREFERAVGGNGPEIG